MTNLTKPLFVYVNWSENPNFEEKSIMTFDSFEMKCYIATRDFKPRSGYDKTSIKVLFDNGDEYHCRLDLDQDCRGFKNHVTNMIEYNAKRESNLDCVAFLKTIKF